VWFIFQCLILSFSCLFYLFNLGFHLNTFIETSVWSHLRSSPPNSVQTCLDRRPYLYCPDSYKEAKTMLRYILCFAFLELRIRINTLEGTSLCALFRFAPKLTSALFLTCLAIATFGDSSQDESILKTDIDEMPIPRKWFKVSYKYLILVIKFDLLLND